MNHIRIDVTDAKECAVPKEKFKINRYSFIQGNTTEDLVHTSEPYIHLQVLRPKDDEQRDKALNYFNEHGKRYVTFVNRNEILLFLGRTREIYIKSTSTPVDIDDLNNLIPQAAHWFRYYGIEQSK